MATWRITPIMVATVVDRGRIARVIASLHVCTWLLFVDMLKASFLRNRDFSWNRLTNDLFFTNRLLLFIFGTSNWYFWRYDIKFHIFIDAQAMYYNISLDCAHTNKVSQSQTAIFGVAYMRPYIFYIPHLLLRVARACIIMSHLQKDWMVRQMFNSSFNMLIISAARVYCRCKNINKVEIQLYVKKMRDIFTWNINLLNSKIITREISLHNLVCAREKDINLYKIFIIKTNSMLYYVAKIF